MKRYKQPYTPTISNQWLEVTDIKELKKLVQLYYEKKLLGKSVINSHKGVKIELVKSGIKHVLNYKKQIAIQLRMIEILEDVLRIAEFTNFKLPLPDEGANILGYLHFRALIQAEGLMYQCRLVIRMTNDGKFYYHHTTYKRIKKTQP